MPNNEGIQLIQNFLDVNKRANKSSSSKSGGVIKTIGNRFLGQARSERLALMPDPGYKDINQVFDFAGHPGATVNNINTYRTLSINRYQQYAMYDAMADDTVISSALDMYADDATQTDSKGVRLWVTSDDEICQKAAQNILDNFDIKKEVWKIARTLAHYGDVYFELFYDKKVDKSSVKLTEGETVTESTSQSLKECVENFTEDHTNVLLEVDSKAHRRSDGYVINRVQIVPDIENMFDLQVNGSTVAFARVPSAQANYDSKLGYISVDESVTDIKYYPSDKFIHFSLDQSDRRNKEYFTVQMQGGDLFRFEIVRGKSMIHDVFRVQRSLELLEYTILLNRVSKSSIFRFVKVEVGQMSKTNIEVTLRKIKNLIESKLTINTQDGTFKSYADPGPIENFLYIPVKEGIGDITIDSVGGDVNVRDIADIDYYGNKLFAGLKIPKSFLNFEDTLSSFGGGGALTKQDERYARTIKRLQAFLVSGFTDLLNIVLENRGMENFINKFEVKMVQPYTSEDASRDEMFTARLDMVKQFIETLSGVADASGGGIVIDNQKMVDYVSETIFADAAIKDILVVVNKTGKVDGEVDLGSGGGLDSGFEDIPEGDLSDTGEIEPSSPEGEEIEGGEGEIPTGGGEMANSEDFGVEWADLV